MNSIFHVQNKFYGLLLQIITILGFFIIYLVNEFSITDLHVFVGVLWEMSIFPLMGLLFVLPVFHAILWYKQKWKLCSLCLLNFLMGVVTLYIVCSKVILN